MKKVENKTGIIYKERTFWSKAQQKYIASKLPYCGGCGKIVHDLGQIYCAYCGKRIAERGEDDENNHI